MRTYRLRRLVLILLAVAAAGSLPSAGAHAAHDGSENSWPLYVTVEHKGRPVAGLDASNFHVFLDDQRQEFTVEAPDTPASIVFVVESTQRSWAYHRLIATAIHGFLDAAPDGNWYALATFNGGTNIVVDFTKRKHDVFSAFWNLPEPQWDDVGTYDALCDILDSASDISGRRIVIFIGSGADNFSSRSFGDIESRLESSEATLYAIGIGAAATNPDTAYSAPNLDLEQLQVRGFLSMLARKSGGDVWFPSFETMLRMAMDRIAEDLTAQYKLVVKGTPPADQRFHRVRVSAVTVMDERTKRLKVRARDGIRRP